MRCRAATACTHRNQGVCATRNEAAADVADPEKRPSSAPSVVARRNLIGTTGARAPTVRYEAGNGWAGERIEFRAWPTGSLEKRRIDASVHPAVSEERSPLATGWGGLKGVVPLRDDGTMPVGRCGGTG